jgi:hypothetical protein
VKHYLLAALGLAVFCFGGYRYVADHHIGAPPLHITCVAPDHVVTSWVPDSQMGRVTAGGGQPGNTVKYLGWTEIGGCGQSLVLKVGAP